MKRGNFKIYGLPDFGIESLSQKRATDVHGYNKTEQDGQGLKPRDGEIAFGTTEVVP